MTRGRKRKPTAMRILEGNPSKRPLPVNEPRPEPARPSCPAHLDAVARKEWFRVIRQLGLVGLVTHLDRGGLAGYCVAWSRWVDAELKLKQFGAVVKSPNGYPMLSPYLVIAHHAMKDMRAFLVEFGMSPASRARVATEQEQPIPARRSAMTGTDGLPRRHPARFFETPE